MPYERLFIAAQKGSSMARINEWIHREEGFRSKPYACSEGVLTFGHGLTYITEEESKILVENRIRKIVDQLDRYLNERDISIDGFRFDVLTDMCYQLGFDGVIKFKRMFAALRDMDYDRAADEMLNSKWNIQTPERCLKQSMRMRHGY